MIKKLNPFIFITPFVLFIILNGSIIWINLEQSSFTLTRRQKFFSHSTSKQSHPAISIDGNTDFNITADLEGWLGDGTPLNPYIIDGIIIAFFYGRAMIEIKNTNVFIQITNSIMHHGSTGIFLENVANVKLINNTITNTYDGIILFGTYNTMLINNSIENNSKNGIYFVDSQNNSLIKNKISNNNNNGIFLEYSGNNIIIDNTISNNAEIGIFLEESRNSQIIDNDLINNSLQIWRYIPPYTLPDFDNYYNQKIINNSVNGKSLIYWINQRDKSLSENAGQIFLINCTSIGVQNQYFDNNAGGIVVISGSMNMVTNNTFAGRTRIHLQDTKNSTIADNRIMDSSDEGITILNSLNCSILTNSVINSKNNGIFLSLSNNCNISGNNIINNWDGVHIFTSYNVILKKNTISNNDNFGIHIYNSDNTLIIENEIEFNDEYGVYINHFSENNEVRNNSYYKNNIGSSQAADDGSNNVFTFNYWYDWISPDKNNNGFVDLPYHIEGIANNTDLFPLASPPSFFKHTTSSKTSSSNIYLVLLTFVIIISIKRYRKKIQE